MAHDIILLHMALEIEHKYLVVGDSYRGMACSQRHIRQGYLSRDPERTVRIRIVDEKGFITVKGITAGDTRLECEYEIPLEDAESMLKICLLPLLEKIRYIVPYKGKIWEVDEFKGDQASLVMAEIELESSDEKYELPPFAGENVTGNPDYYNSNLTTYKGN